MSQKENKKETTNKKLSKEELKDVAGGDMELQTIHGSNNRLDED